jgi:hypothetical protein
MPMKGEYPFTGQPERRRRGCKRLSVTIRGKTPGGSGPKSRQESRAGRLPDDTRLKEGDAVHINRLQTRVAPREPISRP